MTISVNNIIKKLPIKRRKKIKKRANELILKVKCARKGCNHSVGRAHGIGWEKDYCSATCAFQDQ